MKSGRHPYGYLDRQTDSVRVQMAKGQNIAGFPIGILYIDDVWYPMLPGNVVNGWSYDFPVRLKAVEGLNVDRLFAASDGVLEDLKQAIEQLEQEGVRAITGACGFFGNFQREAAAAAHVPVALSSLVQIPWIQPLLHPDKKIGILTADASSITPRLLQSCGVFDTSRLAFGDLRHAPEFSCILEGRGDFDNGKVKQEMLNVARNLLLENPDVGAILLECSDMPPYAAYVQNEVGLPVFDFMTMIHWLVRSVSQRPYHGFI